MAYGERPAGKPYHHKEYWTSRPPNYGGGPRGPRRAGLPHKTFTHRVERARAKEALRRDGKSGFERGNALSN